jgi:hypothetical protein
LSSVSGVKETRDGESSRESSIPYHVLVALTPLSPKFKLFKNYK